MIHVGSLVVFHGAEPVSYEVKVDFCNSGVADFCTDSYSVIRQVQKKLNVKIGDIMIYVEDEKGNIIIKKGQLKPV